MFDAGLINPKRLSNQVRSSPPEGVCCGCDMRSRSLTRLSRILASQGTDNLRYLIRDLGLRQIPQRATWTPRQRGVRSFYSEKHKNNIFADELKDARDLDRRRSRALAQGENSFGNSWVEQPSGPAEPGINELVIPCLAGRQRYQLGAIANGLGSAWASIVYRRGSLDANWQGRITDKTSPCLNVPSCGGLWRVKFMDLEIWDGSARRCRSFGTTHGTWDPTVWCFPLLFAFFRRCNFSKANPSPRLCTRRGLVSVRLWRPSAWWARSTDGNPFLRS